MSTTYRVTFKQPGVRPVNKATIEPGPAPSLVRIVGMKEKWHYWPYFADPSPPPDGWPTETVTRSKWNPLYWIIGPTYDAPVEGFVHVADYAVDVVVPASDIDIAVPEENDP